MISINDKYYLITVAKVLIIAVLILVPATYITLAIRQQMNQTKTIKVTGLTWLYQTIVEVPTVVENEGWEVPDNAIILSSERRYKYTHFIRTGKTNVPMSHYADYYHYSVKKYIPIKTITTTGDNTKTPYWEDVEIKGQERLRKEQYYYVQSGGIEFELEDYDKWSNLDVGDTITVTVDDDNRIIRLSY